MILPGAGRWARRRQEPAPAARVRLLMARRPIEPRIDPNRGEPTARPGVEADVFREALSRWASTVTVVSVRDGDAVHATTVTSFFPVSADPPLVAVALGPGAQVVPWMDPGATFVVSFLGESQRGLASRFADSFPVGPSPFPTDGAPVVRGALVGLVCTVREAHATAGGSRVVVGRVEDAQVGEGSPLLYQARSYRRMSPQE
jgi:flavin reductase (NADH)